MALKSSSKKRNFFTKLLSIFLLIGFLFFVWWMIFGKIWKINNIEILNAKHTNIENIKADVYNISQTKKFFIIPNDHILLLSNKKIINHIIENYPSVEFVEVNKTKERDIIISIKDRMPMGVWCDQLCYFFDDEGVLFKKSFDYTGSVFTKWGDNSSTTLNFYDKVYCFEMCIDKVFVNFLTQNKIMKVDIDKDDLKLFTEYGFYIKALNNASTTMRNMSLFKAEYKGNFKDLQYVDVRFADKIFYK